MADMSCFYEHLKAPPMFMFLLCIQVVCAPSRASSWVHILASLFWVKPFTMIKVWYLLCFCVVKWYLRMLVVYQCHVITIFLLCLFIWSMPVVGTLTFQPFTFKQTKKNSTFHTQDSHTFPVSQTATVLVTGLFEQWASKWSEVYKSSIDSTAIRMWCHSSDVGDYWDWEAQS